MPRVPRTTGRLKTHWTNTALTVTLAAAATVVGVHLAVVAPAVSPVTPPLALTAYTTVVTGAAATIAQAQPSTADRRRGHDGHGHG